MRTRLFKSTLLPEPVPPMMPTFFPNGTLPQPIMKAATSEADTISIPRNVIRQYLEACPAAARMAIYGKALRGGPEMDPNPMAATAAKRPSEIKPAVFYSRIPPDEIRAEGGGKNQPKRLVKKIKKVVDIFWKM